MMSKKTRNAAGWFLLQLLLATLLIGCTFEDNIEAFRRGKMAPNLNKPVDIEDTAIEMVYVPSGSFQMGDTKGEGGYYGLPVHTVTLTGFYMGKYPVTQVQYQAVMGTNPSYFSSNPASGETQGNRPVEQESWYGALVFCNKLSIAEGLSPAYRISGSTDPSDWGAVPDRYTTDEAWDAVVIVNGANGYRLPTEAQWEYAAKGGDGSPGNYTYSGSDNVGEVAWYRSNSGDMTHEVGKKVPNGLGLHDMSGNVWEWCWDWSGYYTGEDQDDPTGTASGTLRVQRGGSCFDLAEDTRSAYRGMSTPGRDGSNLGFRLVREAAGWEYGEHTVIFNKNNTDAGSTEANPQTVTVTPPAASVGTLPEPPARPGYIFNGWNTQANGGGTVFTDKTTVTESITVYAQWAEVIISLSGIEMIKVPGGSFLMGDTRGGGFSTELPVHTVTLTSGFYMGKYQVTQAQYQAVMGNNPSSFKNAVAGESGTPGKLPAEQVSWYDAIEFCNALSVREGLIPYYTIDKTTGDPNNTGSYDTLKWLVTRNDSANGYRLPTEAQREYAAKGGNGSPGNYTYSGSDNVGEVAWYRSNSGDMTHEVGKKVPNGLGLYDMSGNVYEWCWNWYGDYTGGTQTDPMGAASGAYRVVRGGGWNALAVGVRSAFRSNYYPNFRTDGIGFRLVCPSSSPGSLGGGGRK